MEEVNAKSSAILALSGNRDPDIRVWVGGKFYTPVLDHNRLAFELPVKTREFCLTSKYLIPSHATGNTSQDRRILGVSVKNLFLDGEEIPLQDPCLDLGWYSIEKKSRWTNGCGYVKCSNPFVNISIELEESRSLDYGHSRHSLPPDRIIAMAFESLGDNCEFGMFQRRVGAEPISLLRFAGVRLPQLMRGLKEQFAGISVRDNLSTEVLGTEYMVQVRNYSYQYHSGVHIHQSQPEQVIREQAEKLEFQRLAFFENLTEPYKLYLFKRNEPVELSDIKALLAALRRYGPVTLLWVVEHNSNTPPPGTVEVLADGLLKGYIDRFAERKSAGQFSFLGWLQLTRRAFEFWSGSLNHPEFKVRMT